MRISDLLFGLLFALLGVGVFIYALWLPSMPGQRYGAGAFPAVLGAHFFAAGGRSLGAATGRATSHRASPGWRHGRVTLPCWPTSCSHWVRFIGYVILDEYVGFALLGFAILMLFFLRSGVPRSRVRSSPR